MNVKKLLALLLALCLMLAAAPGLAAPTRDAKAMEVKVDDNLTSLVTLIVNAAVLQGTPAEPGAALGFPNLAKDETPSGLLAACALAWGIKAGVLPYNYEIGDRDTIALSMEEADELYHRVFTNPMFAFRMLTDEEAEAAKSEKMYRTWYTGRELNIALASKCNYGVYIYSATFDGTDAEILCDVFTAKETEVWQSAEYLPEEALVWECNARISLRRAPDSAFGYTVNAFSFSPFYQAGDLNRWTEFENDKMEYSVNLPGILGVADDTASNRVWQTADGKATLTIAAVDEKITFDDAVARYQASHPGDIIKQEREFDRFTAVGDGYFTFIITSDEMDRVYTVAFTFPAEYQAEYEFYAEIIRNSLSIWGLSNG